MSLRVLHVIPSVGPFRGGPSVMMATTARGLAAAGVDVTIAASDDNGPVRLDVPLAMPIREDGVVHLYFPRQARTYTFSWPLDRWLARHIAEYDVVHVHALFSFATLAAARWARRCGVPYVVRPLGTLNRWGVRHRRPFLKALSYLLIERRILNGAAVIHYTSEQERREAEELGVTGRSVVIPNAVDLSRVPPAIPGAWRAQFPYLRDRLIILFLSRIDPKKGLELLLRAFAQIRHDVPDAALVIAGAGEPGYVEHLRRMANDLGVDVVWVGFLQGDSKWAALTDADIFVLPSYSENFGIAAVEAMARGVPVIVSDEVGIHREIASAGTGRVVPCAVAPLADAIRQLAHDPELRRNLGNRCLALVKRVFTLEHVTAELIALYTQIVNTHRARSTVGSTH